MTIQLDSIRQKLAKLASSDPQNQLFGASRHQHRLGAVASEAKVAAYEQRHGVKLPADYRQYLL